jgi:hypothetical protein
MTKLRWDYLLGKGFVPSQLYHQNTPRDSLRVESLRESSDNLTILRSQMLGCHNRLRNSMSHQLDINTAKWFYDHVIHLITYDPVCN